MLAGALNNPAVVLDMSDMRRVEQIQREALHEAERYGDAQLATFLHANCVACYWLLGDWDEAMAIADRSIAEFEESPHVLEGPSRLFRGYMLLARGHRDPSLADFERALERARETPDDAQTMAPALIRSAWAYLQVARASEARALFEEALPQLRKDPHARPWAMAEVALELGESSAIREILEMLPASTGQRAMLAVVDEEFEKAAELYAAANVRRFEAEARLRLAKQLLASRRTAEGEAQLVQSLDFYRSVGATLFVERSAQFLAESQRDSAYASAKRSVIPAT